jgi:hypothetical protein
MIRLTNTFKKGLQAFLFNLLYLFCSLIFIVFPNHETIIGFSANHFNGDPRYIYEKLKVKKTIRMYFVTELQEELNRLSKTSIEAYHCRNLTMIPLFVKTKVWITSHGPYFIPGYNLSSLFKRHHGKWVDTWHGVTTEKGSGIGRTKMLRQYDLGFVTSDFYMRYHISLEKSIADKLRITGSPRTDPLLDGSLDRSKILKNLGLPSNRINILYAPSHGNPWMGEKENTKRLFPFIGDEEFIREMAEFCSLKECNFIVRTHPDWENTNKDHAKALAGLIEESNNVFYIPLNKCPLTEPIIYITDILITDYSSIASDFTVLNRITIYLDYGLPEERFIFKLRERGGFVIRSNDDLIETLGAILESPQRCEETIKENRNRYARTIYEYMDGRASQRCADEILRFLE